MALPNVNVGVGFARPPRPQRARRRPRLRSQVVGRPQMGLPTPAAPPRQTVHPAAKPAAPTLAAPAASGIAYAPPPQTSAGADIRTGANEAWAGAQTSWRDSVYNAAMQLGDPTAIARLRADPQFAGYTFVTDPNSVFSTLDRQQKEGNLGIDNSAAQNNTFFSGLRLNDRQKLSAEIGRDRGTGVQDYERALRDYAVALATARGSYNTDIRSADRTDLEAANATNPEPTGKLPAPPSKKPAPGSTHHVPSDPSPRPSTKKGRQPNMRQGSGRIPYKKPRKKK